MQTARTVRIQHVQYADSTYSMQTARTVRRQHVQYADSTYSMQTARTVCRQHVQSNEYLLEDLQRPVGSHEDVDAEVELSTANEEGVFNIP
jgi:hypothetical protein